MNDPLGFLLTWPTCGTWLPGDARGWVRYRHGRREPDPALERRSAARMAEDECRLSPEERAIVERQVAETCAARGWTLHAVNCRSNHVHVVVSAREARPEKVRNDLKAWTSRRLRERSDPDRARWWAERGSARHLFTEDALSNAITYVTEAQDRKHLDP